MNLQLFWSAQYFKVELYNTLKFQYLLIDLRVLIDPYSKFY